MTTSASTPLCEGIRSSVSPQLCTDLFSANPIPSLLIACPTGIVTLINPAMEEYSGFSNHECIGGTLMSLPLCNGNDAAERLMEISLQGEEVDGYQCSLSHRDGSPLPAIVSTRRIRHQGVLHLLLSITDIAELKKADEERRANEIRFRTLTDKALMAVIIYDEERVHYINQTAAELLQVPSAELTNWPTDKLLAMIVPADRPYIDRLLKDLLAGPELGSSRATFRIARADGQTLYLDGMSRMVYLEGRRHVMFHGLDVTKLHRSLDELNQANQLLASREKALEEKNIALQQILAQFEQGKQETQRAFRAHVEATVKPVLKALESRIGRSDRALVERLRRASHDLVSPFVGALKDGQPALSPRELEVCDLIRHQLTSRQIAVKCGVSEHTVAEWRKRIRQKLGLVSKNVNLVSYLKNLKF